MTKSTLLSYFTTLSISKAHTLCHCCKTMTGYLARGRPCGGGAGGQVHAAATVLQRRHSAGICLHLVQSGPALFTLLGLPGCFFLSFFLVGGLLRIVYALVGALTIGYTNVKKCVPWCSAMHENCSASELHCIRPALHQACSASGLLCISTALHQNCSASELLCIRTALHQNCTQACSASELLCIRTALHQACSASELLCVRTALHQNCSASELLCIRPALHQNCSASELLCIRPALHQNCSASELICIRPALHQNCSASELLCIRTALHQNCTQACNASELLCIRTARCQNCSVSELLCIRTALHQNCTQACDAVPSFVHMCDSSAGSGFFKRHAALLALAVCSNICGSCTPLLCTS